jgi:hypothetical protein
MGDQEKQDLAALKAMKTASEVGAVLLCMI